jgi:hypothetical protein
LYCIFLSEIWSLHIVRHFLLTDILLTSMTISSIVTIICRNNKSSHRLLTSMTICPTHIWQWDKRHDIQVKVIFWFDYINWAFTPALFYHFPCISPLFSQSCFILIPIHSPLVYAV